MAVTQKLGIGGQSVELQLVTFNKRLLSRFRAETVYNRFGRQDGIPAHGGRAISYRRMESIYSAGNGGSAAAGSAPTALVEGTFVYATSLVDATWTQVVATVSQYGQALLMSDLTEEQSIDMVVPETTENFAEAMTDALDLITRDVLVAGTNVQYRGTNGSRGDIGSGDYLTLAELRAAKRTLLNNNARPIKSEGGKFVAIINPNTLYDLEGDSNITNFWQYAGDRGVDQNQLFDVEFRDLPMGFRVFVTTNVRVFAGGGFSAADVVATMLIGEEFYGTSKFDTMPARIITHDRGTSGIVDPLDQVASIGWKASWGAARLNEALGVRIEHNTSAMNMG